MTQSSDIEEQVVKDNDESKLPRRRLNKKWISVPQLVYEDEQEDLDDFVEPNFNDKVEKKRQRKKDESCLEKSKKPKKKRKSVCDSENSTEIQEMWDSITNNSKVCLFVCLLSESLVSCSVFSEIVLDFHCLCC